jgi:uncharacterized protein YacL
MRRWVVVGTIGVICGSLLGWLVWSLTANVPAAVVVGAAIASILLVLAVGGARHNATFARTPTRLAEAEAKRRRVQEAMEATREQDT